jgi:hypothetical protein
MDASERISLDDTDEFESLWVSLDEFMFEPMDNWLKTKIKTKLVNEGYDVKAVRFCDGNVEIEILAVEPDRIITNYYYWNNFREKNRI